MSDYDIATLNQTFSKDTAIQFFAAQGGQGAARLSFGGNVLEVHLQGAHISSCTLKGKEILWLSEIAEYGPGKAIRGGIPICWPWFGQHKEPGSRPQHGYARRSNFNVTSTHANNEYSAITLNLAADATEYKEWRGKLEFELEIRLGDEVWMELRTKNTSDETLTISNAMHTYFAVSDIDNIEIPQLTGLEYLDKTLDYARLTQTEPLKVDHNVDAVYQNPPKEVALIDSGDNSTLNINYWGCNNLVVWNPSLAVAKLMPDFNDEGYRSMVCIEPANALDSAFEIDPGGIQKTGQILKLIF